MRLRLRPLSTLTTSQNKGLGSKPSEAGKLNPDDGGALLTGREELGVFGISVNSRDLARLGVLAEDRRHPKHWKVADWARSSAATGMSIESIEADHVCRTLENRSHCWK